MRVSKQARREAKQIYRACLVDGRLDEERVRQVIDSLLDLRPRGHFDILLHLYRLVKLDVQRRTARVESARPLSPTQRGAVASRLSALYGAGLDLTFVEKPNLIGGIRVRVGSDLYDGTVARHLARLAASF